jgi:hypothetical protein
LIVYGQLSDCFHKVRVYIGFQGMSCTHIYGINNYPSCSGNGVCIHHTCVCNQGWSSIGDMHLEKHVDCDINISLIKYWSLVNAILSCITVLTVSYCLLVEYSYFQGNIRQFFSRDGKNTFSLFFGLTAVMVIMYSICKMIEPTEAYIGSPTHIHMSIISFGILGFAMFSASAFTLFLTKFLRNRMKFMKSDGKESLIHIMDIASTRIYTISCAISIIMLVLFMICSFLQPDTSDAVYIAYQIIYLFTFCKFALPLSYILHMFISELKKTILTATTEGDREDVICGSGKQTCLSSKVAETTKKIKHLIRQFSIIHMIFTPAIVSFIPVNLLFVTWYFIRRKFIYLFTLQNTLVGIFGSFLVIALHISGRRKSRIFAAVEVGSNKA